MRTSQAFFFSWYLVSPLSHNKLRRKDKSLFPKIKFQFGYKINRKGKISTIIAFDRAIDDAYFAKYRAAFGVHYVQLVRTFGLPTTNGDMNKSDAEWLIKTPEGLAMVSNWLDGRAHLGPEGKDVEDIFYWQVKAEDARAVSWLVDALEVPALAIRMTRLAD